VLADGHARERRRRLALRPGGDDHQAARIAVRGAGACLARELQVAEALRGLDVVDERTSHQEYLAAMLARDVDDLLHAVDVRRERRHEDASLRVREHAIERAADRAFGRPMAGHERVGGVADEQRHALLAVMREPREVGGLGVDGRVVDLEVAGVDDRAGRRGDGVAAGVDDGVRHADALDAETADLDDVARHDRAQLDVVDAELLELVGDEPERERHAVDRHRHSADQERHGADMVLMAVREEERLDLRGVLEQVRHVRDDDVDAERGRIREHHPAVHEDGFVATLVNHEVHADLAEAA
jgi:hypothetical protein